MKTWQSILLHLGVTVAQVFVAAPVLSGNSASSAFGNLGIQVGAQTALAGLQIWAATKNSNTDPNGKPLVESVSGGFTTAK